jgi:hypothetical protein
MQSSEKWRRVGIVRTDVPEERVAIMFSVKRTREEGTALTVGFLYLEDGDDTLLRNVGSHKTYTAHIPEASFFVITAVRTSNSTKAFQFNNIFILVL